MNRAGRIVAAAVLALAAILASGSAARAQQTGTVTGVAVDGETGAALVGADVTLHLASDSTLTATGVTQERGRFLLLAVHPGRYFLRVATMGHAALATDAFDVVSSQTTDLGTLRLAVSPLTLDSLTVVTERPAVTYESDRTGYRVDAMGVAAGGSVSDALTDIPEIEMGVDGQVTLRGRSPRIYVNGRPAPYDGESLAIFLQQFPAELIERIEIIHEPGASFAAEGSGGIVNIVLKQGVELGATTSVYLTADTRGRTGVGARTTYQKGPVTLSGGGNGSWSDINTSTFDLRQNLLTEPTTFTRQDGSRTASSLGGGGNLNADWTAGKRTHVGVQARVMRSGNDADGLTTTTWLDELQTPTSRYDRSSRSDGDNLSGNVQASLRHSWEPRRHELTADVTWQRGSNTGAQTLEATTLDLASAPDVVPPELSYENTRRRSTTLRTSVDYRHPWGKEGSLRVGYRGNLERADDRRALRQVDDPVATPDGTETVDAYVHRQQVTSGYVSVSHGFGPVSVDGGVRVEHTGMTFDVPGLGSFDNTYTDFFPSGGAVVRLGRRARVNVTYSRRVSRPGAGVLNPKDRSTDPLNRQVGNPHVEPTFTHSLTLNASATLGHTNIGLSPHWSWVVNGWAPITTVDSLGVSTRTYENLTGERSYGLTTYVSTRPHEGWNVNLFVSGRRQIRDASNLAARYSGTSTLWSSRMMLAGRVTSALALTGTFTYTPPVQLPQGRTSSRKSANLGVRYQLLGRRMGLALTLVDPFDLARRSSTTTGDVSYVQIARSFQSSRSASFRLSYVLGGRGHRTGG